MAVKLTCREHLGGESYEETLFLWSLVPRS